VKRFTLILATMLVLVMLGVAAAQTPAPAPTATPPAAADGVVYVAVLNSPATYDPATPLAVGGSLGTIPHSHKCQLTLKTLANTLNHIRHQSPQSSGHCIGLLCFILRTAQQTIAFAHHTHVA